MGVGQDKTCYALSLHDADNLNELEYVLQIPLINEKICKNI